MFQFHLLVQNPVNKLWKELVRNELMFGSQFSVDINGHGFDLVTKNGNMKSVFSRIVLPSSQTNTSAGKVWHARQLNHTDRYQVVNAGIYFPSKRIRVQTVAFLLQCDDMTSLSLFFLIIIYFPNILCQNISFVFNTFSGSHLQYMYSFSGSCHLLFNSGNLQQRLRGLPENLNWSPWQGALMHGIGAY